MFTGFASENTPAIQVWDFFRTFASSSAVRSISLADDCAPIQFFQTGSSSTAIRVYLPTCPIEGKQITIVNAKYSSNNQSLAIYSSDTSGTGSNNLLYTLGLGGSLVLTYSKNFIALGPNSFGTSSGWLSLNQSPVSADNAYAALIGGNQNVATGFASTVIGGQANTNNGSYGSVVGGTNNIVSSLYSSVLGGTNHNASSSYSAIVAGLGNTSNAEYSFVAGGSYGTARSIAGNTVFAASNNPIATSSPGICQSGLLLMGRQTTDATATRLTSNFSAAGSFNQVILPNNSAYTFQGTCIANVTAGGTTSGWKFEGVIKRGANAASTTLVAAVTPTVIAQDVGAVTWVLAITADTTYGGIAVTVTGVAATTIRWVVKIETTEVTF